MAVNRWSSSRPRSAIFDPNARGGLMDDRTIMATGGLVGAVPLRRNATPLHRRFPTIAHMRQHARRHVPHFVFEYMDGGAGTDIGIAHNWAALDAVELVPRYGVMPSLPPIEVELFG